MTSKETVQRCRRCNSAIPDGGQMLCMGVQPIALIDDVTDDDCPKRRGAPEALANKKRPGRKPKVTKEPEAKVALPDSRTDSDRFGQIRTDSDRFGQAQSDPEPKMAEADPIHHPSHYAWRGGLESIEIARELCQGSDGIAAYLIGCATKYTYRYPRKNGLQDLDKAIECLTMLRAIETRKGGDTDAR